ncbi:hypothetical protein A6A22_19440 [Arthrobacter sp. OY3WO11]|nr:hypothetical protein A6A22_19440 [Arthrobacter sp. OY3WO11]
MTAPAAQWQTDHRDSGTDQEAILVRDVENRKNGLQPVEFQYYDDDSASTLALQSGRADLTFGPNAAAACNDEGIPAPLPQRGDSFA